MRKPEYSASPAWIRVGRDSVAVTVLARPGAPRAGILRIDPRGPVVGLKSPPERGKANTELIEIVSRMAGVARAAVELVAGASARQKSLRIKASDPPTLAARLHAMALEAGKTR
ncbi:MAG TPA: DUF167 domain-containing protein [Candidatus Binataceae bacterium]|nr:DUF167 domain-containing protein [Candidatus Binataceae bacterium]